LPIAASAEVALTRAKELQARDQLQEALDVFSTVRFGDPLREQADRLRGAIQDELLRRSRAARAAPPPPGTAPK
jgi:hypothetical protein